MKVVMIETGGWGGIAHYTWNLCQALAEQKADVTLMTHARYELSRLPSGFVAEPCFAGRAGYLRNAWRLWRRLAAVAPDVVHVQSLLSTRFDPALWMLLGRKVPLVFTLHNVRPHEHTDQDSAVQWMCCRNAPGVIVHTQDGLKEARKHLGTSVRIDVIHHGDYAFFGRHHAYDRSAARHLLELPSQAPLILAFGAIRPYKGIHGLISAMYVIRERHPDARLIVVGPLLGGTEQEYRRAITAAGLDATVVFRPQYVPHEQVAAYFAAADVAVFNYRDVTDSGALRIACSLGTPVVATAVGAFAEFLTDRQTARLVPPNDLGELTAALGDVLADPGAAAVRAKAARELADAQWSWHQSAIATLALYQAVGSGQTRPESMVAASR
jgi:glycosyltransferase involved in cell wall biosynthesis